MEQPLFAALDALFHFSGASGRCVSFQGSNSHCATRKMVVLDWTSRLPGKMPPPSAALIGGEIRSENIGFVIGRVAAANQPFRQIQIVVGGAQGSRALELAFIEPCGHLSPSLGGGLLIDSDPFCPCGADRE